MGKKLLLPCPHCSSQQVVRNGHPHSKKLEFFCKNCQKYFYEDTAKGYPPTSFPFPVIAYLLYFHKKIPAFSDMREYRKFVSQWLKCLGIKKGEISRQIIHHWIKNYEPLLEKVISFQEARDYCHKILQESLKGIPKEVLKAKTYPYKASLRILEQSLGRRFCVDLARRNPVFFKELTDIVSKFKVYCRPVIEDEQWVERLGRRLHRFFTGVTQ